MSKKEEVGVLDYRILKRYVFDENKPLKILTPKLKEVIYYGWSETTNGIGINHLSMLGMLPIKVAASDIGMAADLINRPIRPPKGITVQTAGETLMSSGYAIDQQTMMWTIKSLGEMMQLIGTGSVTIEQ